MAEFLSQRFQDQAVDEFPNIGYEPNGLEIPLFVIVSEVIGLDLPIHKNNYLRKNVLPEPSGIDWECAFVDPENHEANMP